MVSILNIVLPIFLLVAAGYFLKRCGIAKPDWVPALNGFVYYVSLPAVIIGSFIGIDWRQGAAVTALWFNLLAIALFAALLWALLYRARLPGTLKAGIFLASLVGNTVYMGFPVAAPAIGFGNTDPMFVSSAVQLVLGLMLSVLAAEFWVLKSRDWKTYALDFAKNPLIISLAAGVILGILEVRLGAALEKPLSMLAATASPAALVALGMFCHGKFKLEHWPFSVLLAGVKLAALPVFIILLAKPFHLPLPSLKSAMLMAAMPTAVTAFVVAEKFRLNREFVANAIIVSTLFSIFSISFFLSVAIP